MGSASPIGEAVRRRSAVLMGMAVISGRIRRAWMTDESIRSFQTAFWAESVIDRSPKVIDRKNVLLVAIIAMDKMPYVILQPILIRSAKDSRPILDIGVMVSFVDEIGKIIVGAIPIIEVR